MAEIKCIDTFAYQIRRAAEKERGNDLGGACLDFHDSKTLYNSANKLGGFAISEEFLSLDQNEKIKQLIELMN